MGFDREPSARPARRAARTCTAIAQTRAAAGRTVVAGRKSSSFFRLLTDVMMPSASRLQSKLVSTTKSGLCPSSWWRRSWSSGLWIALTLAQRDSRASFTSLTVNRCARSSRAGPGRASAGPRAGRPSSSPSMRSASEFLLLRERLKTALSASRASAFRPRAWSACAAR
eukprot:scaffold18209_cov33-Tisochrysis_lutea.AAC.2